MAATRREVRQGLLPLLSQLPIFPLDDAQLFPRALLPLHVFEDRYRQMTADCLRTEGVIAIATLRRNPGTDSLLPSVCRVAGVGRIVAHRVNPDGTYNILLNGLGRVLILGETPSDEPYRRVQARFLRDRWPKGFAVEQARQTIWVLVQRLAALLPDGGHPLLALARLGRTTGELVDIVTSVLLRERTVRLKMFHSVDVSLRCDQLSEALLRLIANLSPGSSMLN